MEEILFKIFPVQSKAHSGFFRISNNTIIYSLNLTSRAIILKFLGIVPCIEINLSDVVNFKYVNQEWVGLQLVSYGAVINYKKADKVKERIINFFSEKKASEFIEALRKIKNQ